MIKLAVFPKCFIDDISERRMSLFDWIQMAAELEPDGLELYWRFLESYDSKYLSRVRAAIEDRGFTMPMMCHSPDFTVVDNAARQKEIEQAKQMIRVTAELGGSFCRILSGQKRPQVSLDDGIRMTVESIQACLDTAGANNIVLVMENHYKDGPWQYPEFAQKIEVFMKIIEQMDSPFFGVQFDPSNCITAAEDPLELLEKVKYRVKTMHASDRYLEEGTTMEQLRASDGLVGYHSKLHHGVIGKGLNDYDKIFLTLKEVGFQGWVSIEDGLNGMDELKESMRFLKQMRKTYFG